MLRMALDEAEIDASKYFLIPIRDLRIDDLWFHILFRRVHGSR